ncbi:MAG: hypothetical protein KF817_09670 [Phycisphaeraceae bacterium]|nr:hypothetical protein [Phycisphaeraceae bacterium]
MTPIRSGRPTRRLPGTAALLAACIAAPASADVVLFTDREAFQALGSVVTHEDFESAAPGVVGSPAFFSGSGLLVESSNPGWLLDVTDTTAMSYNTTPGGVRHLRVGYSTGSTVVTFSFGETPAGAPVLLNTFGFDLTGFQDLGGLGGFNVQLIDEQGGVEHVFVPGAGAWFAEFHGIYRAVPFMAIRVELIASDTVGFDEITVIAVPAPAVGALLLPLLAGAGARRRRRHGLG